MIFIRVALLLAGQKSCTSKSHLALRLCEDVHNRKVDSLPISRLMTFRHENMKTDNWLKQ
jgi:hypothetical protein